jgi:hypothetical protein
MSKNRQPTLDIGSHINARRQLLPEAGATEERTLSAVSCTPWFGWGCPVRPQVGDPLGWPTHVPLAWTRLSPRAMSASTPRLRHDGCAP